MVEFDFIRFDPRYRALPPDEAQAFIHLWVTCVHLRRDAFSKDEIEGAMLPDMAGVDAACFARMVASAITSGMLSRGPGGRVTVDGVKTKHDALRWPNADPKKSLCGPSVSGEEIKGKEKKQDSPETAEDDGSAPVSDSVFVFGADMLVGKGSGPWHVTEALHETYVVAYPGVVLLAEYRIAAAWLLSNKANRKTRGGMPKFLNGWLARNQNRGGRAAPAPAPKQHRPPADVLYDD